MTDTICKNFDHETFVEQQPGTKARMRCRRCKLSLPAIYCPSDKAHFWFNPPWLPARTASKCHHCAAEIRARGEVPLTC